MKSYNNQKFRLHMANCEHRPLRNFILDFTKRYDFLANFRVQSILLELKNRKGGFRWNFSKTYNEKPQKVKKIQRKAPFQERTSNKKNPLFFAKKFSDPVPSQPSANWVGSSGFQDIVELISRADRSWIFMIGSFLRRSQMTAWVPDGSPISVPKMCWTLAFHATQVIGDKGFMQSFNTAPHSVYNSLFLE